FLKNTADVIFECNLLCKCDAQKCPNRILQRGITCRLEVFWTGRERGWGVRAAEDIPRGAMVCEYVGEYINEDEADKRANDLYLMEL
ncbi:histone H3 lysine 9 methyltransferase, partial [Guillardia theta CCMP2712]